MATLVSIPIGDEASTHLGQDVLLCVSQFLEPLEYCSVSRFFLRVAEERAEEFLKRTEQRCFQPRSITLSPTEQAATKPSMSSLETDKWRLRLGLSVLERYRSFYEEKHPTKGRSQTVSRKRKRKRTIPEEESSSSESDLSSPLETFSPALEMIEPNVTSPRLLWNRASRVPLAATKGFFQGPSVLLPNQRHIAFFCDLYHQIVIVDVSSGSGRIIRVVDARLSIPSGGLSPHRDSMTDLRLFCSRDGHLILYCSHQEKSPLEYNPTTAVASSVAETVTLDTESSSSSSSSPPRQKIRKTQREDASSIYNSASDSGRNNPHGDALAPKPLSAPTCWFTVWKVTEDDDDDVDIQHEYFRTLDYDLSSTNQSSIHKNNTSSSNVQQPIDPLLLPPVQDMAVCSSSGTIVLLRYNHQSHRSTTRSSSSSSLAFRNDTCWIQSFCAREGSLLREKHILPLRRDEAEFLSIEDSKLSFAGESGEHVLVTLYCASSVTKSSDDRVSVIETIRSFRHYTFATHGLEPIDSMETGTPTKISTVHDDEDEEEDDDDEDEDDDELDRFVQHAGRRILYCTSRKRYFLCDPKEICWTGEVLCVGTDGRFSREGEPSSSSSSSSSSDASFAMKMKRWKVRSASGDLALLEDPDEESVVLDEVHLGTGKKIRSISTDISRTTKNRSLYALDSVLVPSTNNNNKNKNSEFFVVLSGLENPHRSSIIFKILASS